MARFRMTTMVFLIYLLILSPPTLLSADMPSLDTIWQTDPAQKPTVQQWKKTTHFMRQKETVQLIWQDEN